MIEQQEKPFKDVLLGLHSWIRPVTSFSPVFSRVQQIVLLLCVTAVIFYFLLFIALTVMYIPSLNQQVITFYTNNNAYEIVVCLIIQCIQSLMASNAVFVAITFPIDSHACKSANTQSECTDKKNPFDTTQDLCSWHVTAQKCLINEADVILHLFFKFHCQFYYFERES